MVILSAKVKKDEITADGKLFYQMVSELGGKQVRIGFQRGEAEHDGVDMVDIAMWNELGTSRSPSRPFLRQSVDNNKQRIVSFFKSRIKKMLVTAAPAEQILKEIGIFQKGLIQKTIRDGEFAPNAPSTIKRKHSEHPLIDTGRMRQSVNYIIKAKGEGDD